MEKSATVEGNAIFWDGEILSKKADWEWDRGVLLLYIMEKRTPCARYIYILITIKAL